MMILRLLFLFEDRLLFMRLVFFGVLNIDQNILYSTVKKRAEVV